MKRKLGLREVINISSDDEEVANDEDNDYIAQIYMTNGGAQPDAEEINKVKAILRNVVSIFPNIDDSYVVSICHRFTNQERADAEGSVINAILEGGHYQKKAHDKKRRKFDERKEDVGDERGNRPERDPKYLELASGFLDMEFRDILRDQITDVVHEKQSLSDAYALLADYQRGAVNNLPRGRPRAARKTSDGRPPSAAIYSGLVRELSEARKTERAKKEEIRRREAEIADEEAYIIIQGGGVECQCCFSEFPLVGMIPCMGDTVHFFCPTCVKSHAETEIGLLRYKLKCFAMDKCEAEFGKATLANVLGKKMMRTLDDLQQQDEIAQAGIEGLHSCPFCDFKAICPDVESDREFRCQREDCRKVSCRLCNLESHVPQTCEEAKDKGHPARQRVEEAMSKALIRTCPNPKCQLKIVKEDGCNRMMCVRCRTMLCYLCKKDITKEMYDHFRNTNSTCILHDTVSLADMHLSEVSDARKQAIQKVLEDNPDLKEEDIQVAPPKNDSANTRQARHVDNPPRERVIRPPYIPARVIAEMNAARPPRPRVPLRPQSNAAVADNVFQYGAVPGGHVQHQNAQPMPLFPPAPAPAAPLPHALQPQYVMGYQGDFAGEFAYMGAIQPGYQAPVWPADLQPALNIPLPQQQVPMAAQVENPVPRVGRRTRWEQQLQQLQQLQQQPPMHAVNPAAIGAPPTAATAATATSAGLAQPPVPRNAQPDINQIELGGGRRSQRNRSALRRMEFPDLNVRFGSL
ncbi:hypothetical protein AJ80_08872 [Polytolypa hystricis UAMH7299]|uniref:RING-type domain-containing protein n=1 Tax=Polytolypa hystricis (strain UAMH7299) TaxID=1447883 RepID=A0A2B7X0I9_POLH7|nr:hypothetical protein AJ80_08872 [Polytolypa hystricis UAMH7299]